MVIEKDECEIFEAQDLSDESLTDSMESLDDDDDDEDEEKYGEDDDPIAAANMREEARKAKREKKLKEIEDERAI